MVRLDIRKQKLGGAPSMPLRLCGVAAQLRLEHEQLGILDPLAEPALPCDGGQRFGVGLRGA
ncbi:hypothetical protein ACFQGW_12875 [Xanthomonas theicola]|uniref:hypothetical protein n=1 Tax=Xanthomonas theicola TaxID=56464 RepID=UPI0026D292B6